MAYSFFRIEREKSRFIIVLAILLVCFYFLTAWIVFTIVKNYFEIVHGQRGYPVAEVKFSFPSLVENLGVLVAAVFIAALHLFTSIKDLSEKVLKIFEAEPLNIDYPPHKQLKNIIEEASVASGGCKIEGCIINSSGLNAFSVSDYGGKNYIGVTEGLLIRLNRSQLEAVVGHEAAHIACGDALLVSVACSVFGMYESAFRQLRESVVELRFVLPILLLTAVGIMKFFNGLVLMFISQQKEFRADAAAVRLTRNPLALAQSLYIISKAWNGRFNETEGLSSLCIVEPATGSKPVSLTHPPVEERINILLNMAHADQSALERMLDNLKPIVKTTHRNFSGAFKKTKELRDKKGWFLFQENNWKGPFLFSELADLKWLGPMHLVRKDGAIVVTKAFEDNDLRRLFKSDARGVSPRYSCPYCSHAVVEVTYEGAKVYRCLSCEGILADSKEVKKILIRQERGFRPDIIAKAGVVKAEKKERLKRIGEIKTPFIYNCPRCERKMRRKLFSFYTPVEIDNCIYCGMVWFDRDELETIQVLYDESPHKDELLA